MNVDELVRMVREGKKPVVKLTSNLWDESWGEKGMVAEVVAIEDNVDCDGYKLTFDYNRFKDQNLPLQGHTYWLAGGSKMGTAFESGLMKEDNIVEEVYFNPGQDVPVTLADTNPDIYWEFVNSGFNGSYVQWLEKQLEELVPDCMKSWKKGL